MDVVQKSHRGKWNSVERLLFLLLLLLVFLLFVIIIVVVLVGFFRPLTSPFIFFKNNKKSVLQPFPFWEVQC